MTSTFNASHMPGPTDEAKALQLTQEAACDAMYDALNDVRSENPRLSRDAVHQQPRFLEKKRAYEATVEQLVTLLGPDAHCSKVDTDLWQTFSDWHKDEYGFRPRDGHYPRAVVLKRLEIE